MSECRSKEVKYDEGGMVVARKPRSRTFVTVINLCAFVVVGSIYFFFFQVVDGDSFYRGRSGVTAISKRDPSFSARSKLESRINIIS